MPSALRVENPVRTDDLPVSTVSDKEVIVHQEVHPVPAPFDGGPIISAVPEIPMEAFWVHRAHQGPVNALVVSAKGTAAYSGGQDGKVVFSSMVRGQSDAGYRIRTEVLLEAKKPVLALALSPDQKILLVAQFSSVVAFDLESREIIGRMTRIKGRILSLAWEPRGELVAFGRANGDVYVWNFRGRGRHAGEDSMQALERYEAGSSPIIRIAFHPSARAFFTAERAGTVSLWRLLRTESELGLRDRAAEVDRSRQGRTALPVGHLAAQVEDLWLDRQGEILYVSSADGMVHRWKVRGLRPLPALEVGTDSQLTIQGVRLRHPREGFIELLATSGRGQRVKFWCAVPPADPAKVDVPHARPIVVEGPSKPEEKAEVPQGIDPELLAELEEAEGVSIASKPAKADKPALVAYSQLFRSPPELLRTGERQPVLWAAEQSGNLLTLNLAALRNSEVWLSRAEACPSGSLTER